jgi:hypothetical protein
LDTQASDPAREKPVNIRLISAARRYGKSPAGKRQPFRISTSRKKRHFARFHPEKCDSKSPLNMFAI